MSVVAKMKEQFNKGGGMTPQAHAEFLKVQKQKEEEAVRIAKARAARYNITLRSTQLSQSVEDTRRKSNVVPRPDPSKIVKGTTNDDYKKKVADSSSAPKPLVQLKKVGLPDKIGEALHHNRDPSVAKAVVETAAKVAPEPEIVKEEEKKAAEESTAAAEDTVVLEAKTEKNETVQVEVHQDVVDVLTEAKVEVTPEVVSTLQTEDAPSVVGETFEMKTLQQALASGDDNAINSAVVTEFLEAHAPEMVPEVPKMMEEYKGNEEELMQKLVEEHPDPAEVIIQEASSAPAPAAEAAPAPTTEEAAITEAVMEVMEKKDEALKEQLEELKAEQVAVEEVAAAAAAAATTDASAASATEAEERERVNTQFIISGENTNGEWEVTAAEAPAVAE